MNERYVSPFPKPEGLDRELLDCLAEEAAEVIQRVTKAHRFGLSEAQPEHMDNRDRLSHEVGNLLELVQVLGDRGLLNYAVVQQGRRVKREKLLIYLQNQE
jgi:hypothetical protein